MFPTTRGNIHRNGRDRLDDRASPFGPQHRRHFHSQNGANDISRQGPFFGMPFRSPLGRPNNQDPISQAEAQIAMRSPGMGGPLGRGLGLRVSSMIDLNPSAGFESFRGTHPFPQMLRPPPAQPRLATLAGLFQPPANMPMLHPIHHGAYSQFDDPWFASGPEGIPRSPVLGGMPAPPVHEDYVTNPLYSPHSPRHPPILIPTHHRMPPMDINYHSPNFPSIPRQGPRPVVRPPFSRGGSDLGSSGSTSSNIYVTPNGRMGNYCAPYAEDYESEVDERERALRELELLQYYDAAGGLGNYLWGPAT